MASFKKVIKFLSSMQFAVFLLVLLAAACCAGSFITQGQTFEWYAQMYSERTAGLILALQLDDAFHSWWFILISAFLCLNLLFCNVVRLPSLIERTKKESDPERIIKGPHTCEARVKDANAVFRRMHMPEPKTVTADGKTVRVSKKNTIGIWGAWVTHVGVLLLIAGFSLGQMLKQEYTVYGVPGQIKPVADTGYFVEIDDFRTLRNEDGSLNQYVTDITVRNMSTSADSTGVKASVTVNGPASIYGWRYYQNSTGWAADITILKNGEPLQEEVLCAGESLRVADLPDLVIVLNAVYPDLVYSGQGMPTTASDELNHPGYLYSVYYRNEILGMNVLDGEEPLTIDDYTVTFHDPQSYTLIQVKKDSFAWLAFAGAVITMLGLLLSFYLQPSAVWAVEDGEESTMFGYSRKGGIIFREAFEQAAQAAETGE